MRIGALIKQSLVDWEEKVVAVIFTKGCNFRCGYCHNPELVLPKLIQQTNDISSERVLAYLKTRQHWLDGAVITGGEPTMQNDLPDFIRTIKSLGYKVKLDTNGSNPDELKLLIEAHLLDFVAMDIKTILEPGSYFEISNYSHPQLLDRVNQSISLLRNSNIEYQFRTTIDKRFHSDELIEKLQQFFKNDNYTLQNLRKDSRVELFTPSLFDS